ncbi:U-box domain-containing protein, partial [Metarhizium majus ARSEF 297]
MPKQRVPIRNARPADDVGPSPVALQLHPIPSKRSLVVKVVPPRAPAAQIEHVPCDIVLVLDVSTSMEDDAPVPGETERTGLTVLDLTKHAALTIIETLNDRDRLGIVSFATNSTIVQTLTHMDTSNKDEARRKIKALDPNGSTNLWHGIRDGIQIFEQSAENGNIRAMMVLTDGMPNHMCPQQGYIPKLKTLPRLPAAIHTFGFGYGLRSGLLKSLAEYGHGNYAFIPDAGMIGTVFVHAVANLQATFATAAALTLTYPKSMEIHEVGAQTVLKQLPEEVGPQSSRQMALQIPLGSLQFGQSRDVFLRINESPGENGTDAASCHSLVVSATLSYRPANIYGSNTVGAPVTIACRASVLEASSMPDAEIAYHESRAEICSFLSSIFPLGPDFEHRPNLGKHETYKKQLRSLITEIPAKDFADEKNMSLMQDLNGPEPQGQISLAINNIKFLQKWGVHYLPSYYNAHSQQICNSFKDPGPLQYGADSLLFTECRDRLNSAFDDLPPPEPTSNRRYGGHSDSWGHNAPVKMSRYRNASGVCFAGSTPVELGSGRMVHIRRLRRGMKVRTPTGTRKVAMVLKTAVQEETLCHVGNLLVTPWHPISTDGKAWGFPAFLSDGTVRYTGSVYSVMLQRDRNSRSHALRVAGIWGVTLGHGLTAGNDTRAHYFFGDYNRVGKSLSQLGVDKLGVVEGRGVDRGGSGLVCGFKRAEQPRRLSIEHGGIPPRSMVTRTTQCVGIDSA